MRNLKLSLLLSVAFLLLSVVSLSAEVCLTDAEFNELETLYKRFGTLISEQESDNRQLRMQLIEVEEHLAEAATQQTASMNAQASLGISIAALEASLREQNADAIKNTVIAVLLSLLAGLTAGLLL